MTVTVVIFLVAFGSGVTARKRDGRAVGLKHARHRSRLEVRHYTGRKGMARYPPDRWGGRGESRGGESMELPLEYAWTGDTGI